MQHENTFIFSLGRTGCENFISNLNMNRVKINSFDIFYERTTKEECLKEVDQTRKPQVIKFYIETLNNNDVHDLFLRIASVNKYHFLHFYRSNSLKHFLTRKLQDNLIGEYGKDYQEFYFDEEEYEKFKKTNKIHNEYFLSVFGEYLDTSYDLDTPSFHYPRSVDPYDESLCKKFIINYNEIRFT